MESDDSMTSRNRYKCEESIRSLNIKYNNHNSMAVFWNKNQIFIHEVLNFTKVSKYIVPQYHIHDLLLYNNFIICLDSKGNLHTISLKFKNATYLIKAAYLPVQQDILAVCYYTSELLACLKVNSSRVMLSIHKLNAYLQLKSLVVVNSESILSQQAQSKIMKISKINVSDLDKLKTALNVTENYSDDHYLLLISLDELTIHAGIFTSQTKEVSLQKIYSSPSKICDIDVKEAQIVIALKIGTIIKLNLETKEHEKMHLNTALYKITVTNNNILYTDGLTMWTTSLKNKKNIKRYFPKQVHDFIIIGEQIICTTFTSIIYSFPIDDYEIDYYENEKDTSAETINNLECINEIFEQIERNNKIAKKIKDEETFISCLALANRKDIMDDMFLSNVTVYRNYENVQKDHPEIILTEKIKEYFKIDTILFLVEFSTTSMHHVIKNILTKLKENLRIHITLSSDNKMLKSVTVKLREYLKKSMYLIPLKTKLSHINVSIQLIVKLPEVYEKRQFVYSVLYTKNVLLTAEHFIKTHDDCKTISLKKPERTLQELILDSFQHLYGHIYEIKNINSTNIPYSFYVRLPNNYKEIFRNETHSRMNLEKRVHDVLTKEYSDDFFNSKSSIKIEIGENNIFVEIVNDGFSDPLLKVTGDMRIGYDIRNFFARILHGGDIEREVNHTFYTTVENLQKTVKSYIFRSANDYSPVFDQFERNIIGSLPI